MMLKKAYRALFRSLDIDTKGWFLIVLGSLVWSLTMVKSGLTYSYGMGFWGPNGHDGIWHLSLIEGLSLGNWKMPIFAGESISGYHIGFDLIVSFLKKRVIGQ